MKPGKGGTIDSRELSTLKMGDSIGKHTRIVKDGSVFLYVGIGWIEERKACQEDCDSFPLVMYPDTVGEHFARGGVA